MRRHLALLGVLLAVWLAPAWAEAATTWSTTTCEYAEVNALVSAATTVAGDTVNIHAGNCDWSSTLNIGGKNITLTGQTETPTNDQCDVPGQTTHTCIRGSTIPIIQNAASATGGTPAGFFRITRLNLRSAVSGNTGTCGNYFNGMIQLAGLSPNNRVDHITLSTTYCNGFAVTGKARGVIDHNLLTSGTGKFLHVTTTIHHKFWFPTDNVNGYGDGSWASVSSLGGADNMFFETNTFKNANATQLQYFSDDIMGARTVYRYNIIENGNLDNHGTESGGRFRSARQREVYNNTFSLTLPGGLIAGPVNSRGGAEMVFNNTITGNRNSGNTVSYYRALRPPVTGSNAWDYYPWGMCGTNAITSITRGGTDNLTATATHGLHESGVSTSSYVTIAGASPSQYNGPIIGHKISGTQFTYTMASDPGADATGTITLTSPFDQNTDTTGYRCLDQTGNGAGGMITGDGPPFTAVSPLAWTNQISEPAYSWGSTVNNSTTSAGTTIDAPNVVKFNRDYYQYNSAFDGTATVGNGATGGVGVGAIGSRPGTCTTGVAYWATDEGEWDSTHSGVDGKLYVCTATNTWTAKYGENSSGLPYTYPHPLTLLDPETPPEPPAPSTFGNTAVGGSTWNSSAAVPLYAKFTAPASGGTITKLSVYASKLTAGTFAMGGAIYADNAGVPGARLAVDSGDVTVSGTTPAWYDINISYAFSASQVLWLAFWPNGTELVYNYEPTGGNFSFGAGTFETWPDPNVTSNPSTRLASIYATYGSVASGLDPPTNMVNLAAGATTTTTQVLTWNAGSDAQGAITSTIELCAGSGCSNYVTQATGLSSPATLTGLLPSTIYSARGWHVDTDGNVSVIKSNAVTFTTSTPSALIPPAIPAGLRLIGVSTSTNATLVWTANTDSDLAGYKVYSRREGTANFVLMATRTPISASETHSPLTQYQVSHSVAGIYYFSVSAIDTDNNESGRSAEVSLSMSGMPARSATTNRSPR